MAITWAWASWESYLQDAWCSSEGKRPQSQFIFFNFIHLYLLMKGTWLHCTFFATRLYLQILSTEQSETIGCALSRTVLQASQPNKKHEHFCIQKQCVSNSKRLVCFQCVSNGKFMRVDWVQQSRQRLANTVLSQLCSVIFCFALRGLSNVH